MWERPDGAFGNQVVVTAPPNCLKIRNDAFAICGQNAIVALPHKRVPFLLNSLISRTILSVRLLIGKIKTGIR